MEARRVRCGCCAECEKNCGDVEKSSSVYEEVNAAKKLKHIPREKISCASLGSEESHEAKKRGKNHRREVTLVRDVFPDACAASPASNASSEAQKRFDSRREKRSLWSLNDSMIRERLFVLARKDSEKETENEYESVSKLSDDILKHITFKDGGVQRSGKGGKKKEKSAEKSEEGKEFLTLEDLRAIEELEKQKATKVFAHSDPFVDEPDSPANDGDSSATQKNNESNSDSKKPEKKSEKKRREYEKRALWTLLGEEGRVNLFERAPSVDSPPTEYENVTCFEKQQNLAATSSPDSDVIGRKGEFYIGAQKKETAERLCRRRKTFRFYHRIPSKCFIFDYTLIPVDLILWMVYRTRKGYHRHFPVTKSRDKRTSVEKWCVANWPNSRVKFEKFNDLIKYYVENASELDDSA